MVTKHGRFTMWRKWRACDVGETKECLENELCSFSKLSGTSPTAQLILQPFRRFTYVTAHSSTLSLLHLRQANSPILLSFLLRHRLLTELILQTFRHFTYVTAHSPTLPLLHLCHSSFPNPSFASPTSQVLHRAHSPTFPLLHLRHSSFSNPSVASPTSQLIPQSFFCFSYFTGSSQSSFSNLSVTSTTSQLILQTFRCFTYVTAHSPTLPSLYLHHSSFSNPSVASPMSQLILRPFFRFSYVTGFSLTSPGEPPMYKVYISTPPSPGVENFQMKICYLLPCRLSNRGPRTCWTRGRHTTMWASL